eukprot:7791205-Pyramimonas_sp.AAC.1
MSSSPPVLLACPLHQSGRAADRPVSGHSSQRGQSAEAAADTRNPLLRNSAPKDISELTAKVCTLDDSGIIG